MEAQIEIGQPVEGEHVSSPFHYLVRQFQSTSNMALKFLLLKRTYMLTVLYNAPNLCVSRIGFSTVLLRS